MPGDIAGFKRQRSVSSDPANKASCSVMMALMNVGGWREGQPSPGSTVVPIRSGDLLDELFTEHYSGMVRLASALLGDRAVAEEVVQEALVRVEPQLRSIDPASHAAYLRRAVMNGARSAVRLDRAKKRQPILVREVTSTPEEEAVLRDDQRRLLVLLDQLPMRQRQCLVLRYYEGLSDSQVADAVGISAGSVKTHVRRGLEALRNKLGGAR